MNWTTIAAKAWEECDDRPLSETEKVALIIEAIHERRLRGADISLLRLTDIASRTPLGIAAIGGICRRRLATINATLGTSYEYTASGYAPSGAGAFGRAGGGKRGRYSKACLVTV